MSTSITHETAKTEYIEADGVRFAYRRFGRPGGAPIVFCHRFRGTMDDWDPAVINGLARERDVILFDNAGVGLSSGQIPDNVRLMADHLLTFLEGLGLSETDLLGFSMGGYVAQFAVLKSPHLFRRLILAGTGPGGGEICSRRPRDSFCGQPTRIGSRGTTIPFLHDLGEEQSRR
jgi:pimeloyl-ACP methyl ester carboxylesterase